MARVIYVPNWLKESLQCTNEVLHRTLYENPISDILSNVHDQANYVRAQLDFSKFVATTIDPSDASQYAQESEIIKNILATNATAKAILFKDNWPKNNHEVNYAIKANSEVAEFDLLHLDTNATRVEDLCFEVFTLHDAPIIYVHGDCAPIDRELLPGEKSRIYSLLMRRILAAAYKQQSIHAGRLDHASFVNQNETLFSLYVSSISYS